MTNKTLDKVMERIRKLLALSKSTNEHEAARAADIAQAMLAEYNLTEGAVVGAATVEFETDGELATDSYPWRRPIGSMVAKLYFCRYYFSPFVKPGTKTKYDQHNFVGQRHNIVVAKLMFEYLIATVERLARDAAKSLPEQQRSPYRVSFRTACSARLVERIYRRIEEAKTKGVAATDNNRQLPALLDMYQKAEDDLKNHLEVEQGLEFTKPKPKAFKKVHRQGVLDGDAAGGEIGLDRQIDNAKPRALPGPVNHKFP